MLTLGWPSKAAYEKRLFSSHDFAVEVDVLDLSERIIGSATFLDGQINILDNAGGTQLVRRTADLLLSDPAGALDFSTASAWSGTTVWADRLLRVRHILRVGSTDVTCVAFVGPPAQISRSGAEVSVTCNDKTALAVRGAPPYTVREGANAVNAIKAILADCTGEARFRFPSSTRRLSKDYSVGWEDAASPWVVAKRIANSELGMQLQYAPDGAALLRVTSASPVMTVPGVTEPASSSVDFTQTNNIVRGFGKATTKTTGKTTIKTQPFAQAQIVPSGSLSPQRLARNGVARYLPLTINDDALTTTAQVKAAVNAELTKSDTLESSTEVACIPFFHADIDDVVSVKVAGTVQNLRLVSASIPLGVTDDMSISPKPRAVSAHPKHKSRVEKLRWKKVTTGKKGHKKTRWKRI